MEVDILVARRRVRIAKPRYPGNQSKNNNHWHKVLGNGVSNVLNRGLRVLSVLNQFYDLVNGGVFRGFDYFGDKNALDKRRATVNGRAYVLL